MMLLFSLWRGGIKGPVRPIQQRLTLREQSATVLMSFSDLTSPNPEQIHGLGCCRYLVEQYSCLLTSGLALYVNTKAHYICEKTPQVIYF